MGKRIFLLSCLLSLNSQINPAYGLLINLGNNVTYDDVSGLYWYNNLRSTYFTNYVEAKAFYEEVTRTVIVGDNIITLDNFHIASRDEYDSLMSNSFNDIANTFNESNIEPDEIYFMGKYDEEGSEGIAEDPNWPELDTSHYWGGFWGEGMIGADGEFYPEDIQWEALGPIAIPDYARTFSYLSTSTWGVSSGPSPVPEPSTMLLLVTGLFGFAGIKKSIKLI